MKKLDLSRRALFNNIADLYDRARPRYPEALVEDLMNVAGLTPVSRVLEIGCGTGQLTVELAKRELSVLAVELGPNLATRAKEKLNGFAKVAVVVADFADWTPPTTFDLVVAANAFHWLDPSTRVKKCVDALRSGGMLVVIDTHWNVGSGRDRFFEESQKCYAGWDPYHVPGYEPKTLDSLPAKHDELESSGYFEEIVLKQYVHEQRYGASDYCELLSSFSDVLSWDSAARSGFLQCIAQLINAVFDGTITRKHVYRMWIARKESQ